MDAIHAIHQEFVFYVLERADIVAWDINGIYVGDVVEENIV